MLGRARRDGVTYARLIRAAMPAKQVWAMDNAQNLILNVAVGGMAGRPDKPANFRASMEVDCVARAEQFPMNGLQALPD